MRYTQTWKKKCYLFLREIVRLLIVRMNVLYWRASLVNADAARSSYMYFRLIHRHLILSNFCIRVLHAILPMHGQLSLR